MEKTISQVVKGVSLATKKSKAGNDYTVLRVTFNTGYTIDQFVTADQLYILNDLVNKAVK